MADDKKKKAGPPPLDASVISGIELIKESTRLRSSVSRVIRQAEVMDRPKKVQIIGGDSEDVQESPPAIIIEKEGDKISKIIVKCPCGRHSELICEYEEENKEAK